MEMERKRISKSSARRASSAIVLLSVGVIVSGTKACQENYAVGAQVKVTQTTTPTATPTEGGDGDATPTPTPTPTGSVVASPTATTPPNTAGLGNAGSGSRNGSNLYQELSALSNNDPSDVAGAAAQGSKPLKDGNWLGRGFKKGKNGSAAEWSDQDGDGFSDAVEEAAGTDPANSMAAPEWILTSVLDKRVKGVDSDMDGIPNTEEAAFGSDPGMIDTDGDGRTDGAERLSGGDPRSAQDGYTDTDSDGLSDEFEVDKGLSPRSLDTDGDGLRDDTELAIGSDPLKMDSDGDGVSDGREYDLSADPVVKDGK